MQMSKKHKKGNETPLWIRIICGFLGVLMILGIVFMVIPTSGQSIAYAAETAAQAEDSLPTDEMISVGLHSGSEAVASFSVQSDSGFALAYRKSDDAADPLMEISAKELTAAVDANLYRYGNGLVTENLGISVNGGYHIQISYFTFSEMGIDDRDNPVYIEPSVGATATDGYSIGNVNDYIQLLSSVDEVRAMEQPIFPYFTESKTYIRLGSYYTEDEAKAALWLLEKSLTVKAEVVSPSDEVITMLDSSTWLPVCELSVKRNKLSLTPATDALFKDSAGRTYRGSLIFDRQDSAHAPLIKVINRLPLEEYVASLLSYEVSSEENAELLKAMAIILRTEASRHKGTHTADGYDVCSDSHCHYFSGSMADATSIRKAVLETAGKILTYDGKAIYTPFTSESGSTTLSSEQAFGKAVDYLPAVITPWEDDVAQRWSVELSPFELYRLLADAGFTEIKGNIKSVAVLAKAESSDYVCEISFTDQFGNSVTVSSCEKIRLIFGSLLPSNNFVVGKAGDEVEIVLRTMSEDGLEYVESAEKLVLKGSYDSFVFSGRGSGCGVGFSVAGGRALAKLGYSYDQMLAIYYPETIIE